MKYAALAALLLAGTSLTTPTPVSAQASLSPEACQPLTSTNLEACCAAENWRDIIRPEDFAFCPPLNSDDNERLGEELDENDGDGSNDSDGGSDGSGGGDDGSNGGTANGGIGNPGNEPGTSVSGPGREVGGAGEDPSGRGMDSPSENTGSSGDNSPGK